MAMPFDRELEDRIVRYARIDTQSDETSPTSPSTAIQLDLLRLLADELREIGAQDVRLTDYGAVLATIPATVETGAPTVALLAHVDTAPGFNAIGVKPVVHRNYDGGAIRFPDAPDLVLSPENSPYLAGKTGEDIVTASGTTLLGADDKAGCAIVMATARHLLANPSLPHGTVRIASPRTRRSAAASHADLPRDLGADFAYTLDGAEKGEIVYESFSADKAPWSASGRLDPSRLGQGQAGQRAAPRRQDHRHPAPCHPTPETTEGREGFIHVYELNGTAAEAELRLILRDFERDGLAAQLGDWSGRSATRSSDRAARPPSPAPITEQYRNMRYWLETDMRPVDLAREACRRCGIEPFSAPIRGGTDGSRLTELGVPTPNIFTGMQNVHGPLEWVSVQDMAAAVGVCLELVQLWAEPSA
jgi:tripeptide aminopeptidase